MVSVFCVGENLWCGGDFESVVDKVVVFHPVVNELVCAALEWVNEVFGFVTNELRNWEQSQVNRFGHVARLANGYGCTHNVVVGSCTFYKL